MMPRPSIYYNDNCPQVCAWLQGFPEAWCHAALTARLRKAPKKPAA